MDPRPTRIDGWLMGRLREHAPLTDEVEKVHKRAERLAGILLKDAEMGVNATLVGGSVGKGTANAPLKDLDLYLELDPRVWGDARSPPIATVLLDNFLQRLRRSLQWQYDNGHVRVERQRHSVAVGYLAEGSANIDVVPMLLLPGTPGVCAIPRRTDGAYVETSVVRQIKLIKHLDGPGRYLREGTRLLKLWSRPREPRLPSYALEILAMYALQRGCERSAAGVLWAALDHLGEDELRSRVHVEKLIPLSEQRFPGVRHRGVIMDPAVVGNNVTYRLSGEEADDIAEQARYTLGRLRKADQLLQQGRSGAAEVFASAWSPRPED